MAKYDLVLHMDSALPEMQQLVFRNANNYLNGLPNEKFELDIVANGAAVRQFSLARQELRDQAQALCARGVVIKLCANALAENNIAADQIWPECRIVPAGLVEIVNLQKSGFAYIKP